MRLTGFIGLIGTSLSLVIRFLFFSPSLAIPLEEANKKLDVIAVFALEDDQNNLLFVDFDKNISIIPLFFTIQDAQNQRNKYVQENPERSNIRLQFFSLGYFKANILPRLEEGFKSRGGGKKLEIALTAPSEDMSKAVELLQKEGYEKNEILSKIDFPVFFTEPMIAGSAPGGGTKELFFPSYSQLEAALVALSSDERNKVKIRVADVSAVVRLIKDESDDRFAIVPTSDFEKVRDYILGDQKNNKQP